MDSQYFDAAGFLSFNLADGEVRGASSEQLALIPYEMLASLEPGDALVNAARGWGEQHGSRLARAIEDGGRPSGVEALAEHLGGTLAVLGMGKCRVEIRGAALLFRMSATSSATAAGQRSLVSGFIGGYLSAVADQQFEVIGLGENRGDDLYWAGNPDAVEQIARQIEGGSEPLEAITALVEGSAA